MNDYRSIEWISGVVRLLDQRALPHQTRYLECKDYREVAKAIQDMVIRGAPALGAAAAFGLALVAYHSKAVDLQGFLEELNRSADELRQSRPTAVNLGWALDRVLSQARNSNTIHAARETVIEEALLIAEEDIQINRRIGLNGVELIPHPTNIIHHCNTGALATVGYGTALGVIRAAHEKGKKVHVFVDETRPRLQGARLTTWELQQLGIPFTLVVDGASGFLLRSGRVDLCIVGCDRVAVNGDTANKIGTFNLALAAYAHSVPFYVAGPLSSFDRSLKSGDDIPIEWRDEREITHIGEYQITPEGCRVENPAFDVTPSQYITAFITEAGIIYPPYHENIPKLIK